MWGEGGGRGDTIQRHHTLHMTINANHRQFKDFQEGELLAVAQVWGGGSRAVHFQCFEDATVMYDE